MIVILLIALRKVRIKSEKNKGLRIENHGFVKFFCLPGTRKEGIGLLYPVLPLNIPLHTPVADYDRSGALPCRIFVM